MEQGKMKRVLTAAALLLFVPALLPAQSIQYYHQDALGSVRAVTDQYGDENELHDFYPYGQECWEEAPPQWGQPLGFTGKERDAESGLDAVVDVGEHDRRQEGGAEQAAHDGAAEGVAVGPAARPA
jgi:hypothetical protein